VEKRNSVFDPTRGTIVAIDEPDKIDVEVAYKDDKVRLVIIDGLSWENEEDTNQHINAMLAKLTSYYKYIKSDQFREKYPDTTKEQITIEVVLRYPPDSSAAKFFSAITDNFAQEGLSFIYGVRGG
jgi:L-arabinose isomerase